MLHGNVNARSKPHQRDLGVARPIQGSVAFSVAGRARQCASPQAGEVFDDVIDRYVEAGLIEQCLYSFTTSRLA